MRSVSLIPVWIYAVSRSLAKAAKVLVADSWLMEHSYTRYNAVHSDFTKKGGPARHQARRWVLKLLGLDAEVSNELGVLVVVRLHHALEFRSGVANDGLATALDRLADTIQLQGVLDRRIQRLDHLVRRILRCKQSDPGTQLISLNAGLGDGWNIGQALGKIGRAHV